MKTKVRNGPPVHEQATEPPKPTRPERLSWPRRQASEKQADRHGQSKKTSLSIVLWSGASIVLLALLWFGAQAIFGSYIVPNLDQVALRLAELARSAEFWANLGLTLVRSIAGFGLAFLLGFPIGLLMGHSKQNNALLFLPVILLQASPPLLWVIPLILVLGTDGAAPVAIVFLVVLPLVVLSVRDARSALHPGLWDVFKIYAPSRRLVLSELYLPALSPALRSSLVLGLVLGFKSSIIGEWFGSHTGIGRMIQGLYSIFDMPGFYALSFVFLTVASLLALGSERLAKILFAQRRASPGTRHKAADKALFIAVEQASTQAVELHEVSLSYGRKVVLRDVNLRIAAGEHVLLCGDSGSGKTSLARVLLGLTKAQQGTVNGPKRAGVLFQEDALLAHRDCLGNVMLPAWQQGRDSEADRQQALRLLQAVGLGEAAKLFPDELSGGMKKRLALARAIMQNPDFIVLDEPFQSLDARSRAELWDLVFSQLEHRQIGALIISHYPQELVGRKLTLISLQNASLSQMPNAAQQILP